MKAALTLVDLASSEARLDSLVLDGLSLNLRRLADGNLDLSRIVQSSPAPRTGTTSPSCGKA